MSVDPLSDVLRAVRLDGAFFYCVEAAPPWSVTTAAARELVPRILPDSEHLISYHILLTGSCWGGIEGGEQVHMKPGDAIVFPHGDANVMSSDRAHLVDTRRTGSAPRPFPSPMILGSDNRDTTFVCGFLGCDVRPFNPLLSLLPRCMHVPGMAGGWLSQFAERVVDESCRARAGSDTVLTRMAELMFIEVVRYHVERARAEGWLAGLSDEIVGPALCALHDRPAHGWTLAELARSIASSRTVLVERFTRLVGLPPMLYLKRWRLQLAAERLTRGTAKISAIATGVGYESEAAFSRAFKKETGVSPAAWRRARQTRAA